jgi:phosphatidylglycerophosphatase B
MINTERDRRGEDASGGRLALRRLALPILLTSAFLPLAFLVPILDSTRAPYFDLSSWFALLTYGITETGGTAGAFIVGVLMLVILITRAGVSRSRRLLEAGVIACFVIILVGGGAAINEYVIKPMFENPRPNIVYLAGADGAGSLGMPVSEFYALDKEERRKHLRAVLEAEPPPVSLHRLIREHWIESIGYSFPSGHALSAMFFATFFLAMGLSWLSMPRLLFLYLLLPWAVWVCYSRLILRVHTPTDITAGGLAGLLLGVLAFVLVTAAIIRRASATPKT